MLSILCISYMKLNSSKVCVSSVLSNKFAKKTKLKLASLLQKALQVTAGQIVRLRCESRGGNPAALIKWFIDDEELRGGSQKNETEIGNNRKWNAVSLIELAFSKVRLFFFSFKLQY